MDKLEKLQAQEEIRQIKAKYSRGVDTADAELLRGILAEECVLEHGLLHRPENRPRLPAGDERVGARARFLERRRACRLWHRQGGIRA